MAIIKLYVAIPNYADIIQIDTYPENQHVAIAIEVRIFAINCLIMQPWLASKACNIDVHICISAGQYQKLLNSIYCLL